MPRIHTDQDDSPARRGVVSPEPAGEGEPGVRSGAEGGTPEAGKPAPERLASIDAFRGFVMLLMLAEALHVSRVAREFPGSPFWRVLAFHTSHVEWAGCSLHDLIQPSFSFLVGVALPYSIAARTARGESRLRMTGHALWRALLLVLLGVFLRSVGSEQTNWTFEDTLTQIGLGYPFLFLLGFCSRPVQWGALALILTGYWAAWALYPLPGPEFDYARVGVPPDWPHHATGFAAHWNKNSNLGAAFDQWFLNLFPRPEPFVANRGGYLTLSFIPTLGTMLLGLLAAGWLRAPMPPARRVQALALMGAAGLLLGLLLHALGVSPLVKRIWTPTWVLFSGGWCFLLLALFYTLVDWRGWRAWAFPLVVIGMNSIAAYVIAHLIEGFIVGSFQTHLGPEVFSLFGRRMAPLVQGATVVAVYWLILFWMYRRRLFLKI